MKDDDTTFDLVVDAGDAILRFRGHWLMRSKAASGDVVLAALDVAQRSQPLSQLRVDLRAVDGWDSLLVVTLMRCECWCHENGAGFERAGVPEAVEHMIALAQAVPANRPQITPPDALLRRFFSTTRVRQAVARGLTAAGFLGEVLLALQRLATGRANMRRRDLVHFIDQCGPGALRIVTLISVLVGMILAYLGSVQLRQIGAQVYVADLVGLGMAREMGALMTAVIMAGRTGAAYAAQLGTMQTRDEIDAVITLGISPVEFLVLPRLIALVMVMPLLVIYSDLLGMLGGAMVAISMDVSAAQYFTELQASVTLQHISAGLMKSVVFGIIIALTGCRAGMQSGRSSESVGKATTDAVVAAVVWLVVADALFNIVYQRLDF